MTVSLHTLISVSIDLLVAPCGSSPSPLLSPAQPELRVLCVCVCVCSRYRLKCYCCTLTSCYFNFARNEERYHHRAMKQITLFRCVQQVC